MESNIETDTESWFSMLRPLNKQTQSVAGSCGARSDPCGRMRAKVDRDSEPQPDLKPRRLEFRARIRFQGAMERQLGKLMLKVRYMD